MSEHVVTIALTAVAALVVALTQIRLGGERQGGGNLALGRRLVTWHTVFGLLALVSWCVFMFLADHAVLGIAALAAWWVTAGLGVLLLVRFLPSRGRHAEAELGEDSWVAGRTLSLLGHLGVLLIVGWFTLVYLGGSA